MSSSKVRPLLSTKLHMKSRDGIAMYCITNLAKIFKRISSNRNLIGNCGNQRSAHVQLMSFQDMPTPAALPMLGTAPEVFLAAYNCRIHKYVDRRHKELGSIFRDRLGPTDTVLISDPDIMRDIFINYEGKYPYHLIPDAWTFYNDKFDVQRGLFFMNGEEWLQIRRVMNKLLLKPNTDTWVEEPISQVADNFVEMWKKKCAFSGYEPNLDSDLYKLSLNVMFAVMLGSAYSKHYKRFETLLERFSLAVRGIFLYSSRMYMLPGKFYERLNSSSWRGFERSMRESLAFGERLVREVYELDDMGAGLTAMLIDNGLNREMVTRILVDMITAAADTTSYTTQWILYLLCKNPDAIEEFSKIAPSTHDKEIYVKGIIKETMRLYPAGAFITRILPSDSNIGGYEVPAGTVLVMSVYTSGRDEKYFPDPLSFQPSRWDKRRFNYGEKVKVPYASIPFAMGARSCIGRRIAMTQMKCFVTKVLHNFSVTSLNNNVVEDVMQMILKPKQDIRVLLQPRT